MAELQNFKHSHRKLIFGTVSIYNFRNEANFFSRSSGFIRKDRLSYNENQRDALFLKFI